ncbi:MAG: hypothetical protein IJ666_01780 [Ruminococcus sp.]|nr:hypothetical protein [Ruminococcus sp.]
MPAVSGSKKDKTESSSSVGKVSVESSEKSNVNYDTDKEYSDNSSDEISKEENQTVYDDGQIKITYTGYTAEKTFSSAKMGFLIENNSDKNITVSNFNLNVNGYTFDTWFYENVPAGKKTNAEMSIRNTELKKNGVEKLGTLEMNFRCIDSDSYETLYHGQYRDCI